MLYHLQLYMKTVQYESMSNVSDKTPSLTLTVSIHCCFSFSVVSMLLCSNDVVVIYFLFGLFFECLFPGVLFSFDDNFLLQPEFHLKKGTGQWSSSKSIVLP